MLESVLDYVLNAIPYMLCTIPVFLLIRAAVYLRTRDKKHFNMLHEVVLLLFCMFCVGVASQTVIPKLEFGVNGIGFVNGNLSGRINLIPGRVFYDIYQECIVNHYFSYFVINFVGNICLFLPIGFGAALLWKNVTVNKIALISAACSVLIELCQLPQARGTDIDDVWLNLLGAVCGYLIYRGLSRIPAFASLFFKVKVRE